MCTEQCVEQLMWLMSNLHGEQCAVQIVLWVISAEKLTLWVVCILSSSHGSSSRCNAYQSACVVVRIELHILSSSCHDQCVKQFTSQPMCIDKLASWPMYIEQLASWPVCVEHLTSRPVCIEHLTSRPVCIEQLASRPVCWTPDVVSNADAVSSWYLVPCTRDQLLSCSWPPYISLFPCCILLAVNHFSTYSVSFEELIKLDTNLSLLSAGGTAVCCEMCAECSELGWTRCELLGRCSDTVIIRPNHLYCC